MTINLQHTPRKKLSVLDMTRDQLRNHKKNLLTREIKQARIVIRRHKKRVKRIKALDWSVIEERWEKSKKFMDALNDQHEEERHLEFMTQLLDVLSQKDDKK